jgi:hypothetical protein
MTGHDKETSFRFVIRLYIKPLHEIQVQFFFLRIFAENIHNRNFTPSYKRLREVDVPCIDDWIVGDSRILLRVTVGDLELIYRNIKNSR